MGRALPSGMKPGRNDPCPCGSGTNTKKCHLDADDALERSLRASSGAFASATTVGGGMVEVVIGGDGGPMHGEGYDDCPICQAKTPAERFRELRKHSVVPWH